MRYQVVRECYVPGLTNGEAILGAIPQEYRPPVFAFDEISKEHYPGFLYIDTGEVHREDPSLETALKGGVRTFGETEGSNNESRWLNPEALAKTGLQVVTFELE
jgi:hypothetical protein